MEEQQQEQPQDEPAHGSDGQPKFFKSANGMIAGATALVIALGGLATTWDKIFGDKPAEKAVAAAPAEPPADQQTVQQEADSTTAKTEAPSSYATDDGGTLRWIDGMWVETSKDGDVYRYEIVSDDGVTTVGLCRKCGEDDADVYLRWPIAGGQALQSLDQQDSWNRAFELTADAPAG